jgi:hypothetical protein
LRPGKIKGITQPGQSKTLSSSVPSAGLRMCGSSCWSFSKRIGSPSKVVERTIRSLGRRLFQDFSSTPQGKTTRGAIGL